MKRTLPLFGTLHLLGILLLAGCGLQGRLTGDTSDVEPTAVVEINAAEFVTGIPGASSSDLADPLFDVPAQLVELNGKTFHLYEFADEQAASAAAGAVSGNGTMVGTSIVEWIESPHFYRSGRLLAIYAGSDPAVLDILRERLGEPFLVGSGMGLPQPSNGEGLRPVPVDSAVILSGVASPIPAFVSASGQWPDLCAQLAEISQPILTGSRIEITLLATPADPDCPPDQLGLPFRLDIPLNWMEMAEGAYTVSVNGTETTLYVPVIPPPADPETGEVSLGPALAPEGGAAEAAPPAIEQGAPVLVPVQAVNVEAGVGSPIPVNVHVAAGWPSLCSQLAEIHQDVRDFHFEITVRAHPGRSDCPPDNFGLTFAMALPLNVVELPAGNYTVAVNGIRTSFTLPITQIVEVAPTETATSPAPTPTSAPATPTSAPPTPTAVPPTPTRPASTTCTNIASYVADVTIPDGTHFLPDSDFVKTWRLRNNGTCTWNQHYTIAFQGGDRLGATADHYALPGTVAPGGTVDISVMLTAPSSPGSFTGRWVLESNSGQRFGVGNGSSPITVEIVVDSGDQANASIAGKVYQDLNNNSIYNIGEPVIAGREVWLLRGSCDQSTPAASQNTGSDGGFRFLGLEAGEYCVALRNPGGHEDALSLLLAAGQNRQDANLRAAISGGPGNSASITGLLWSDFCMLRQDGTTDGNCVSDPVDGWVADGVRNSGEASISGVTVRLLPGPCGTDNPDVVASAITGSDGSYSFVALPAGTYCVSINGSEPANLNILLPGDWTFPGRGIWYHTVELSAGEQQTGINFGWDYQFQ